LRLKLRQRSGAEPLRSFKPQAASAGPRIAGC